MAAGTLLRRRTRPLHCRRTGQWLQFGGLIDALQDAEGPKGAPGVSKGEPAARLRERVAAAARNRRKAAKPQAARKRA